MANFMAGCEQARLTNPWLAVVLGRWRQPRRTRRREPRSGAGGRGPAPHRRVAVRKDLRRIEDVSYKKPIHRIAKTPSVVDFCTLVVQRLMACESVQHRKI